MKIKVADEQTVDIDTLVPDPKNARKHPEKNLRAIRESLKRWGQLEALTVRSQNDVVMGGNARLAVMKELGYKEVKVRYLDCDDQQAAAIALALNRTGELAEWDLDQLKETILELDDLDFELGDLGFEEGDFDFLSENDDDDPEPKEGEDDVPAVEKNELGIELGQIWKLGEHRVMCGDSTSEADTLLLMDGKKADMIFTDPPYGVDYKGINNDSRAGLEDLLRSAFKAASQSSTPGSAVYVFHSDRCGDLFHKVFREFFHFSSMIIWAKPALVLSQTDYQSQHEPCMYGWVEGAAHNWFSDRKQTSIWNFGKESIKGHTTPKPVALVENAIKNSSKRKSLIIDPFLGSGSTLIACEKTKRRCFGMELDPIYCNVMIKRWEDFTGQKAERVQ